MSAAIQSLALVHLRRHPEEAVRILERQTPTDVATILGRAPTATAVRILELLPFGMVAACLEEAQGGVRRQIVLELPVPTAASVLRRLSQSAREDTLSTVPSGTREAIERALRFSRDSAGALADPRAPTLHDDVPVRDAIKYLREIGEPVPSAILVLDRSQHVVGSVPAGRLLVADPDLTVRSVGLDVAHSVAATASVSAVAADERYGLGPVAVIGTSARFVGVLTERVLRDTVRNRPSRPAIRLVSSIAELYWLGLCSALGELSGLPPSTGAVRARAGGDD